LSSGAVRRSCGQVASPILIVVEAVPVDLQKTTDRNPTMAASMLPSLLITELKPAPSAPRVAAAGLSSVMRRGTIGLPARRCLFPLPSDPWLPVPGSGSFSRSEPHDCVRGGRLIVCSEVQDRRLQPKHRGRHHHRPGRDNNRRCCPAGRIWVCCYAIFSFPHSNQVPSVQMQCRTTAILRATATLAFLAPTRFISRTPHTFKADQRWVRCSKPLAASNK
jgi:hypothetical protein